MVSKLWKYLVITVLIEIVPNAQARAADYPDCALDNPVIVEREFMVFFDSNSFNLSSRDLRILDELIAQERANPRQIIEMSAETDGSEESSSVGQLRINRGEAVRSYLIANGISSQWLFVDASGARPPLVVAAPGVSEPQNRRVALWPRGLIEQQTKRNRRDCVNWIRATCWQSPPVPMTSAIRAACDAAFASIE